MFYMPQGTPFVNAIFAPQLDVDGHIDSVIILLSPRQVHLLLDMVGAFSGGGGEICCIHYLFQPQLLPDNLTMTI